MDLLKLSVNVQVTFLVSVLPVFMAIQEESSFSHGSLFTFQEDHRRVSDR